MPRRKPLVTGSIYHIYNRGARKGDIFLGESDYLRWIELLSWCLRYDYPYSLYLDRMKKAKISGGDPAEVLRSIAELHSLPAPPVDVIAWVQMPNHLHLVVKQTINGGIHSFIHRVSTAYSMYFNRKHDASGSVFQGVFKAVPVETEGQFLHVCRYVHINPLSAGLATPHTLSQYLWSSFSRYLEVDEEDPVLTKHHLLDHFSLIEKFREFTLAPFEDEGIALLGEITHDDDFGWYQEVEVSKKARREKVIAAIKAL